MVGSGEIGFTIDNVTDLPVTTVALFLALIPALSPAGLVCHAVPLDGHAEACPRYLGVEFPQSSWPTGPRTREGTLTEVLLTHWPTSLRVLATENDARLPKSA